MIKISDLKKTYDKNSRHANEVLHGISLSLPSTGFVCILGQSGCGKTSLLNAIGGLDSFESGSITVDSTKITRSGSREFERERTDSFGYIFQNYYLLSEHSAAYNVYLGMHTLPISEKEKLQRVKDALKRVDMLRYRKRPVGELSGGQRQRVAIARAIARRPKVIFADEPTGNLDEANTLNICSILKELSADSLVVMVTHEERIARFFADRIITLDEGRIVSDISEWTRTSIQGGDKDTVYSEEYSEERLEGEKLSVRLLSSDSAKPVSITLVIDGDRVIIKHQDPRVVICTPSADAPFIENGKRPVLDAMPASSVDASPTAPDTYHTPTKSRHSGIRLKMLLSEAASLTSGKKLRGFGSALFMILLSLMLSLSIADIVTVSNIDKEDFITTDSHKLSIRLERGSELLDKYQSIELYRGSFREFLDSSKLDFDYIPSTAQAPEYIDSSIPQLGDVSISFGAYDLSDISRLDPSSIIKGRMPRRSDEIVIDRSVIEKLLDKEGILQNLIPNPDYLIGKELTVANKTYRLSIVGICDFGEPSMYLSREAMLAFGSCGTEVMTLSEYRRLTGDTSLPDLALHECIVLSDNVPLHNPWIGVSSYVGSDFTFTLLSIIKSADPSIGAKLIISDEALEPLYRSMIDSQVDIELWCSDKDAILSFIENELPKGLSGKLDIEIYDKYSSDLSEYEGKTALKVDARVIVTASLIIACALMLYLMQRSKIRDRMDLVTVYRLLGIKKSALMTVFAAENLLLTIKYALPSVFAVWLVLYIAPSIEPFSSLEMIFPLSAAALTLGVMILFQLLTAILPLIRLLREPPARLAARYDI